MAQVNTIDSNSVGLRIAEEASFKTLPVTPTWFKFEPNSYSDFGASISTVKRDPIVDDRQARKGILSDVEASAGFNTDLTEKNIQKLLEGAFFADLRQKPKATSISSAATASSRFTGVNMSVFSAGDIVFVSGFNKSANNGAFRVSAVTSTTIDVVGTLVDETISTQVVELIKVGKRAAAGDLDVSAPAGLPTIVSSSLNFTTLGIIPGEWIYIGGEAVGTKYTNAVNNGFKRVRSVAANKLTFDKSFGTMVSESSTAETIEIYIGTILKNEASPSLIKKKFYQLERTLGAPDDSNLSQVQAEYVTGAMLNEVSFKISEKDKIAVDLTYSAADHEKRLASAGLKSGNRPSLLDLEAYNAVDDVLRIKLAEVSATTENNNPVFAFGTSTTLKISNNVSRNNAIGSLGAIGMVAGNFMVSGEITGHFNNVSVMTLVRCNKDVTLDVVMSKDNTGLVIDLPLITLNDGKANVEKDNSIKIGLNYEASTAKSIDDNLDYTAMMVFFDYVPYVAQGCN